MHPAEDNSEIVTFAFFLTAGLFPPFSDFFMEVLGSNRLRMAHLSANTVLVLAIFTHLCESFVGVMLSACVFRWLFRATLCIGTDDTMGSVRFFVRNRHLYFEKGPSS